MGACRVDRDISKSSLVTPTTSSFVATTVAGFFRTQTSTGFFSFV
jgi:hypothetical protein